ncbi:hypothetical protein E3Q22_03884 [Wallemia mellicola]|uniref:rRNA-processing protein FYV7 n=1 Tax=Wallemia mellicola TaxID=1708541 RepID=A0A4T0LZQ8_9BASI|nr:hypothetical protein E3Q24_02066 [Wallemia mellicola]TIB75657.1 hypothetical protein E3Q22_03884 [Wallemia mellicola]TIB76614.1 hypothetical protein E3Q23_01779 [Wallemia mellicola]TIB85191.1 hypothetical protein E3Q21_02099 [Wallemia mellicola]TIB88492.1 hypothetical protein E3Q20_02092 [Wallemia mellicola]
MTGENKPQRNHDKKGFSVARRAGKGAYTGKASKIKEQLIQKAKVKKEYANILKKEGRKDESLPSRPSKPKMKVEEKTDKTTTKPIKDDKRKAQKQKPEPEQDQESQKSQQQQRKRKREQYSKNHQPNMKVRMEDMLEKVKKTVK